MHLSLKLHCLHPIPPPPNLQPSTQDLKRMGSPVFYLPYHSSSIALLHRGTEVFPLIPPDSLCKPTSPRPSPPFLLPSHSGFFSFLGAPVEFRDRVRLLDPRRLPSPYCVCLLLLLQLMSSGKLTVAGSCATEKSSTPYGHFYIFRQLWRERGLEYLVSLLSQTLHGSTVFPGMGLVKRGITPYEYSVVYCEDVSLVVGKPGLESCFCPSPGLSPSTSYSLLCCVWNMGVVTCYPVTNTVTIYWI